MADPLDTTDRENLPVREVANRFIEVFYNQNRLVDAFRAWVHPDYVQHDPNSPTGRDGTIGVLNRCRKPDGKVKEAKGRAKVVDRATNSKLKVSFFGPFFGDYWILDHGDDYRWSLVGEPSGRYLWILHRMATPPEAEREALINRARAMGYDTTMLIRTKQP